MADFMDDMASGIDKDIQNQLAKEPPIEKVPFATLTKKPIGYADGYSSYTQRTGAHSPDGTELTVKINRSDAQEHVKSTSPAMMLDNHSDTFRRINGYGSNNIDNSYEDPTFLIFDIVIMKSESPLFNNDTRQFIWDYSKLVPELEERLNYWNELTNRLLQIFPSDSVNDGSGAKRHYIEAIGGLDLLTKPIIDYPTDIITITITEDIAMTLQYLAELYNNLIYSYDTHRYLIPDNLLRFNLRITMRDVRNMKNSFSVNQDVSKFIYVLHDCQFDFMSTKNFGGDMKRGGFGTQSPAQSAGGIININFKSYSKITAPLLIDNSLIVDFRERDPKNKNWHEVGNDYKTTDEIIQFETLNTKEKDIKYRTASDIISTSNQNKRPGDFHFPEINTSIRGFENLIKKEIIEVRDVIIKKVYEEVNTLITRGETFLGKKVGFTIGKVNVYYDSLQEKVTKFAFMFEDFLDKNVDKVLNRNQTDVTLRSGNIYNQLSQYNEKYPEGDLHPDGTYNQKFPEGDKLPDGKYNEKYPSGTVEPKGTYNQKFPEGDKLPDGKYNQKFPKGDKLPDGKYNEKYPEGDKLPDGKYNQKFPKGDVHPDGTYNEKFPSGSVQPQGTYNEKYPEGDKLPDGIYNEKYPEGDLHPDGTYNEKDPSGNIYNVKFKFLPPVKKLGNVYKNKE